MVVSPLNLGLPRRLINFYKPDCPFSVEFHPTWLKILAENPKNSSVSLGQLNCHKHRGMCKEEEIYYYPTLLLYEDSEKVSEFEEELTSTNALDFMNLPETEGKYSP